MVAIAICDDENKQRSVLETAIVTRLQLDAIDYKIYHFDCGESLCNATKLNTFDIIFLDIEMKKLDGIETAKYLRSQNSPAIIIFVTAYPDFVFQGYEVHAFHYILKPYNTDKIIAVLKSAIHELENVKEQHYTIYSKSGTYKIYLKDILYFYSDKRNIVTVTLNDTYTFYGKLDEIEQELSSSFVRIHQRYLVNMNHVNYVEGNTIFINETALPISRTCKQSFLIAFAKNMLK